jgi:hypothetical protein
MLNEANGNPSTFTQKVYCYELKIRVVGGITKTSARFWALALVLILLPGIASCSLDSVTKQFMDNARDAIESTGEAIVTNVYGDKPEVYNAGRPNLFIGGIRQQSIDPHSEENEKHRLFADNNDAVYIPTYYSGGPITQNAVDETAKVLFDAGDVNNAALGYANYKNGLANDELKGHHYDTIISYSGGTATAVTAIAAQGVTCDTLILISPMKGSLLNWAYEKEISDILAKGYVKKIQVIWSSEDKPTDELGFYQASTFKASKNIEVFEIDLTTTGQDAHIDLFYKYAMEHITEGQYSDPDYKGTCPVQLSGSDFPDSRKDEKEIAPASSSSTSPQQSQSTSSSSSSSDSTHKPPANIIEEVTPQLQEYVGATSESYTNTNSEPSTDTQAIETTKSTDESNTKESSVIPTLYPTTSPPPDTTQETSTTAFDAGRKLAAEAFAETYQSTEPSTDIAQGLEPITQAMESSKSTDESNTKERSIIPTLYPTTSPPLDETNTKESSVIPTLYPTTTPPPNEQDVQETAQQAKQSETKDPTDELDPNLEGKRLAAEAFKETYQSTEQSENADSTSYKSTIPTPTGTADESNTKESSGVTTLYPVTNPPPDESNIKESDLGGVNFTSIKLNCISVSTDSSGGVNFDLILKGQKAEGTSPGINIQNATRIGATAFMTGLAVNDNKFWVNLNPWEVGRIIDEELGESEIGRVMLEADLQMKRDFSNYGNPCVNETGKALWSLLDKKREDLVQRCMNKFPGEIKEASNIILKPVQRHWIVPDKAYAYSNGSLIYIINASLTINSEPVTDHSSFQVKNQDIGTLSRGCIEELNRSAQDYAEYCKNLEERMIQPYVVADINTNEKYEDLREVYAALALAQWYKSTVTPHTDIFRDRLDSSSSAILKSQNPWHPKDVWDKYVYSFRNGEYKCWENTTTKTAKGTRTKFSLHSAGGVEFEDIRDHFVKIEAIPLEVQDQAKKAITDGFVDSRNEVLFGYRLHVNQKKEAQITNTSRESSIESQNSNQGIEDHLKENRTVNATSLISKKSQNPSCESLSAAKVGGNARRITCPDGWMGPDENGECWQMQITS